MLKCVFLGEVSCSTPSAKLSRASTRNEDFLGLSIAMVRGLLVLIVKGRGMSVGSSKSPSCLTLLLGSLSNS